MFRCGLLIVASVVLGACTSPAEHELILRNGTIVDGIGAPSFVGDLAINDDRITAVGDLGDSRGVTEVDVSGLVGAPGFIRGIRVWRTPSIWRTPLVIRQSEN